MSETREKTETVMIIVPVEIDVQRLRDLLCSAVEGGSNYWAIFDRLHRTDDLDYLGVRVTEYESHTEGPRLQRMIAAEDLAKGLERLGECAQRGTMPNEGRPLAFPAAGQHLANFLSENDDAETADVVLQLTVFGTLIYG